MRVKKKENDNFLVLKLCISLGVAYLYFLGICFLSRFSYPNCLFFYPSFALIPAFLNCCIIIFFSFVPTAQTIVWLKSSRKRLIVAIVFLIVLFLFPITLLKNGIVADEEGISKNNLFGEPVQEYIYSDIVSFETTVQYGIQYDIEFSSGESFFLASHQVITFNAFKSDYNMMVFDKILTQHAKRNVEYSYRMLPENTKRFFCKDEVFRYFNQIFQQYY